VAVLNNNAPLEQSLRAVLGRQERTLTGTDEAAIGGSSKHRGGVGSYMEQLPLSSERGGKAAEGGGGQGVLSFLSAATKTTSAILSKATTPKEDAAAIALRTDFGLSSSEAFLGRSVCTSARNVPGVLSLTTSYLLFKPGSATSISSPSIASNPTMGVSASGLPSGWLKVELCELSRAERTKRWRQNAGKTKGYSIELIDQMGSTHIFHGVLHCENVLALLTQAAGAKGVRTKRDGDSLYFLAPAPEFKHEHTQPHIMANAQL